ncbi:phosphatase [Spirochaetia bacterium]|nr:phosphatase [Spirochaetia bacterium]
MKADLHIHSTWSDGSMNIPAIIHLAKRLALDFIALTDHDTMEGREEALEQGKKQGVRIIPGIEISAFNPENGRKVHILGYHIKDAEGMTAACRPYLEDRHRVNLEAVDLIAAAGYPISREDALSHTGLSGILYRQHIIHALADRGYETVFYGELYRKFFKTRGIALVKSRYMDAREAIRLTLDCGGIPVLAHPFQYDSLDLVPALAASGLKGIECWHYTQTPEREKAVKEAAADYDLFLTPGSDFHGLYSEKAVPLGSIGPELEANHPLMVQRLFP